MCIFILITSSCKIQDIKIKGKNSKKENICNTGFKNINPHFLYVGHSFDSNLVRTQPKNLVSYLLHWDQKIKQKLCKWITVLSGEAGYFFQGYWQRKMFQFSEDVLRDSLTTDSEISFIKLYKNKAVGLLTQTPHKWSPFMEALWP